MTLRPEASGQSQFDPAHFIEQQIKAFTATSPANCLSFMNGYVMWDEPLVKFADGDDPIFTEYKGIIDPAHLTPREALAKAYDKNPEDKPVRLSVISWVLPATEETRRSNGAETRVPSRLWSHTRWYGEKFNDALRRFTVELLASMGYLAVAPGSPPLFRMYVNERGQYSNWSERHVAYAAGHGTFSLSDGLITECGIAHRCGSVVTSLELPASCRIAKSPYSNCLFYLGVNCRACIKRCPVGAITEKGHDKNKCLQYLYDLGYLATLLNDDYDTNTSVAGCGLCQTRVPCEFRNPAVKLKVK